jgi:hypothetical protein
MGAATMNTKQAPSIGRAPRHRYDIFADTVYAASEAYKRGSIAEGDRLHDLAKKIHIQIRLTRIANRAFRR